MPLKHPAEAKSRLKPRLGDVQRRKLFESMARHVVTVLKSTSGIDGVSVVTPSDEVESLLRHLGVHVIREGSGEGTAPALVAAVATLCSMQIERLLMISGDLPLLSCEAVQSLLFRPSPHRNMVLAPDRHWIGSNALLCTPPNVIPPLFGGGSFDKHVNRALTAGVACRVVYRPELALDVDLPEDIEFWKQYVATTRQLAESPCHA